MPSHRFATVYRLAIDADPRGGVATGWGGDNRVRSGRDVDLVAAVRAGHRVHGRTVSTSVMRASWGSSRRVGLEPFRCWWRHTSCDVCAAFDGCDVHRGCSCWLFGWEWGAAGGEVESGRFGHDRGSWSVGGGHCDGCCLDRFSGRSDVFADDGCSGRRDLVLDRCQDRRRSPDRPDPRDVWLSAFTSSTR
jgi:hypothetical protein